MKSTTENCWKTVASTKQIFILKDDLLSEIDVKLDNVEHIER